MLKENYKVAYFSMEYGLEDRIKTFSGGLGVLAGDHIKSAADVGFPLIGIGLLYYEGFFKQLIVNGGQVEEYPPFDPTPYMVKIDETVTVPVFGNNVKVGAQVFNYVGEKGEIPLIFLTTNLPENNGLQRGITSRLYAGDQRMRIAQEIVFGKGGMRMLNELNIEAEVYHLNEGHGAFATFGIRHKFKEKGKERTRFTTHTPVPAGHDKFSYDLAYEAVGSEMPEDIKELAGKDGLNMTTLAMSGSSITNAVSYEHKLVSKEMFPGKDIKHVTNGVHHLTWTHPIMQDLFDEYIPMWRANPNSLEHASERIPVDAFLAARKEVKKKFIKEIQSLTGKSLDNDKLTIGFARRSAPYKRPDLIFDDMERLREICDGNVQFVFSGKAHPNDGAGKDLIYKINNIADCTDCPQIVFVPDYNMTIGALLTSGVDIWLNTPTRPKEASGTSGEKAAPNGVVHWSTVDGWWFEVLRKPGWTKGGYDIGPKVIDFQLRDNHVDYQVDSIAAYDILQAQVLPEMLDDEMRAKKGLEAMENAGYFKSQRMFVEGYVKKIYKIKA